ncbi:MULTISPECIES: Fur family transcriptional regulator [Burkholderia]|uniref:Ferric uptake regulation protein n=1 Tax=Burkholderia anthina TaxID=179879 RepID=A0A6P2G5R2_9BURK|nr:MULTISPECIES: transcriptional repressor [Burkholderia]AXK67741.1 transcriptional repressor [Burkholderia sp. IDO3]MBM2769234.1 transcriptional repressor [Burkholderia anthina]PCD60673.1 transcriptional repressor [Burkholderia sp. IDO3]VVU48905.1 Fur family transcriptional regulator [Burkholderia anthina]
MKAIYMELARVGIRPTVSRFSVLKLFREHPATHFTVEQIYRMLSGGPEPFSLASTYRTLATFIDSGLITSASLGDSRVVYELNHGKRHHHLVCRRCAAICDLVEDELDRQFERVASGHRFKYQTASLVITGVCSDCQAKGG